MSYESHKARACRHRAQMYIAEAAAYAADGKSRMEQHYEQLSREAFEMAAIWDSEDDRAMAESRNNDSLGESK